MYKIDELIKKYNSGECTAEEKEILQQWYRSFEWNNKVSSLNEANMEKLQNELWSVIQNDKTNSTLKNGSSALNETPSLLKWWHYASAAAIIIAVTVISFLSNKTDKKIITTVMVETKQKDYNDVQPGTSKAQLVLANGKVMSLDSSRNMQLREEDGTSINQLAGKLVYKDDKAGAGKLLFNTLSTPKGGEYQLELPDGSKVWLNAASSLKFPTHFAGKERIVFLHGEGYFEIAKNEKMPFYVKLDDDITVQVTGTHFNIMGYNDESEIRTTLEEGALKVISQNSIVVLSPFKEAIMKRGPETLEVAKADVAKALAWKNGMIEFDGDDLPNIMRQLSRWYNVEVSFTNEVPQGRYKGAIRRQAPLSDVLEILKLAGVKFKMENNKLIVTGG